MEDYVCISCKRKVVNDNGATKFKCPSCSKYQLVRCTNCRSNASKYTCPSCGFVGPN